MVNLLGFIHNLRGQYRKNFVNKRVTYLDVMIDRINSKRSRPSIILNSNFPRFLLEKEQKNFKQLINFVLNDPILKSFKKSG